LVYFNKADRHVNVGPLREFLAEDKQLVYEDLNALENQNLRNAAHYPPPLAVTYIIPIRF